MLKMTSVAAAMVAGLAYVAPAQAALSLLDNFESYENGGVNGKGAWFATTNSQSVTPSVTAVAGSNASKVLIMPSTGGDNNLAMTAANNGFTVNDGDTATIFYQFKFDVAYDGVNLGTTGNRVAMGFSSTDPQSVDDIASGNFQKLAHWPQLGIFHSAGGTTFGDQYQNDITVQYNATAGDHDIFELGLDAGVWYNFWQVVDTEARTFSMYIQSNDDPEYAVQTLVAEDLDFHSNHYAASDPLESFMLINGTNSDQSVYFDNFHIDTTSATLANPVPEPASLGLLAMGGLMLVRRRRA